MGARFWTVLTLIICVVSLLTACGARNLQQAMDGAKIVDDITIQQKLKDAYNRSITSQYASTQYAKYTIDEQRGNAYIWYGGDENIFAVIRFLRIANGVTKVTFFEYGGIWSDHLAGIRQLLLEK